MDSFDLSSFLPKKKAPSASSTSHHQQSGSLGDDLPKSFGKSGSLASSKHHRQDDTNHSDNQDVPTKKAKQLGTEKEDGKNGADEYTDDDEDESEINQPPLTKQATMSGHERAVTALDLDSSGVRLITGGYDYNVKFWEFNMMDPRLQSFRTIQPWDGYQVKQVQYRRRGDYFLAATASPQMKLYDRDGHQIYEYVRGDMYLMDLRKTKGHIAPLTCCQWHPTDNDRFMTASEDCTVRIWHADTYRYNEKVIVCKPGAGGRTAMAITSATFSLDGKRIAGARQDGMLGIWDVNSTYSKPILNISNAHMSGSETSRILYSEDTFSILTRGGDDTVKLWDQRKFTKPVKEVHGLANRFPETDIIFSPNERYILTGTSAKKGEHGKLVVMDRYSLETVNQVDVCDSSAIRLLWHPTINQIFVGCGDGTTRVFYDPEQSKKGVLLSLSRKPKRLAESYLPSSDVLAMSYTEFEEDKEGELKIKIKRTEGKEFGAQAPVRGAHGSHGMQGSSANQALLSGNFKNNLRDVDPREAVLKYAKVAEEDPKFIGHVYKKTQPKTIYATEKEGKKEDNK